MQACGYLTKTCLEKSVKMTPLQHKYRLRKSRPVQMKCEVVFQMILIPLPWQEKKKSLPNNYCMHESPHFSPLNIDVCRKLTLKFSFLIFSCHLFLDSRFVSCCCVTSCVLFSTTQSFFFFKSCIDQKVLLLNYTFLTAKGHMLRAPVCVFCV